jgi:hypothetical protein
MYVKKIRAEAGQEGHLSIRVDRRKVPTRIILGIERSLRPYADQTPLIGLLQSCQTKIVLTYPRCCAVWNYKSLFACADRNPH